MELKDTFFKTLKEAGEQVKSGLWTCEDLTQLNMVAQDLVDLQLDALKANTDDEKRRCTEATKRLIDHVAGMAFSRINSTQGSILSQMKTVIVRALSAVAPPPINVMISQVITVVV